ncbi:putative bifunctional diguanylate cyclase/phosphodiesterase [Terriglobus roseus]|nr:bifunctional diguanylate cyclase/phosphodiesterase [Terriglobus roseus]
MVPLFFLVVLIILQRQGRDDRRMRWWIYAWLCRVFSLLSLLPTTSARPALWALFLSAIGASACNVCCILSSPLLRQSRRQLYWTGAGFGLPVFAFATLVFFGNGSHWPLYLTVTLGLLGGSFATAQFFRSERRPLAILLLLYALSSLPMVSAISRGDISGALSLVFVQTVLISALVFWWSYPRRSAGLYVTLFGLAVWIVSSPAAGHLFPHLALFAGSVVIGDRIVGIGMIMILAQESLERARQLAFDLEALFAVSPHMMWVVDQETLVPTLANQAAADAHGYSLEEFEKLSVQQLVDPVMLPVLSVGRRQQERSITASLHRRKDGTVFPVDVESREVLMGGRHQRLIMGVDVTEREALLRQLAYETAHDPLTGLYSRKGLMDQEDQLFQKCRAEGTGVALASISLRQFKAVNDTYGDVTGDQCLQILAKRIAAFTCNRGIAARTSGDHFKVLFSGVTGAEEAEQLTNDLLRKLCEPIVLGEISIRMRISIGIAATPKDGYFPAELRSKAQTAMWKACGLSGSIACPFVPEYAADEVKDLRIVAAIEEMLANDSFEVYYQPVCRPGGEIYGLEALLRMNHPVLGSISPAVFIPVAEESGLIISLGQWVLERVCLQIQEWRQIGVPLFPVAVNISGLQFRQSDFSSRILGALDAFDIPCTLLHLEMTESTVLQNISDALGEMEKLSSSGLEFSIDDFGTGYSSLGRLQQMPISTLKIDRSFVTGITPATSLMVAAIISLAHALGMKVIAEGVEFPEELNVLRDLKCDLIQGYIFSRPLPPRTLEALLHAGSCDASKLHFRAQVADQLKPA